ncbi:MAG: DUF3501 family protein [Rhodospirillales bacterium]|nr:DUF3501 family protein [Rhodospirillales bacterium]
MPKGGITRADILSLEDYEAVRAERRGQIAAIKRDRRVSVGPDVTFYFENFDTIWHQIHEMLRIEKGGEGQIEDELRAYAPLVPDGRNLVATMMIEIEEATRRARVLAGLGGIEDTVTFEIGDRRVAATPEGDVERTTSDGKTSSVHFLKFPFSPEQVQAFRVPGTRVVLSIRHRNYDHTAALKEATRTALATDFA